MYNERNIKKSFRDVINSDLKTADIEKPNIKNILVWGLYSKQLERYFKVFGKENVRVFIYEEIFPRKINQTIKEILDYLKISPDKKYKPMDGESLLPLINNELIEEKIAFSETGNPLNDTKPPKDPNTKSIRTSEWKLIYNEHNDSKELYNLLSDPNEETNLFGTGLEIEEILWNNLNKFL